MKRHVCTEIREREKTRESTLGAQGYSEKTKKNGKIDQNKREINQCQATFSTKANIECNAKTFLRGRRCNNEKNVL